MTGPSKRGDVHVSSKRGLSRGAMILIALVVVHLAIAGVFLLRRWQQPHADVKPPRKPRPEVVKIGGVNRPITDIQPRKMLSDDQFAPDDELFIDVGQTPRIATDANPMVESVVEALDTGKHPERLSSLIAPQPFNQVAFDADPQAYLNTVEPGRVWQSAQPGPEVQRIRSLSSQRVRIEQGETVSLKVQTLPQAPVTFTSFDLGAFQNELTSITVQADEKGAAVARFTGTPGTYNDVQILAASPLTSGQVRFYVNVAVEGLQL